MRINRRIRARKDDRCREGSARWQMLLWGAVLDGPAGLNPFDSADEMRAAWRDNREALMPVLGPGRRPFGWWKFDSGLRIDGPLADHLQTRLLVEHGWITTGEAADLERNTPDRYLTSVWFAGAADGHLLRALQLSRRYLESKAAPEFESLAVWHAWRGRPEVAEQYRKRAEVCREAATR